MAVRSCCDVVQAEAAELLAVEHHQQQRQHKRTVEEMTAARDMLKAQLVTERQSSGELSCALAVMQLNLQKQKDQCTRLKRELVRQKEHQARAPPGVVWCVVCLSVCLSVCLCVAPHRRVVSVAPSTRIASLHTTLRFATHRDPHRPACVGALHARVGPRRSATAAVAGIVVEFAVPGGRCRVLADWNVLVDRPAGRQARLMMKPNPNSFTDLRLHSCARCGPRRTRCTRTRRRCARRSWRCSRVSTMRSWLPSTPPSTTRSVRTAVVRFGRVGGWVWVHVLVGGGWVAVCVCSCSERNGYTPST